MNRLTKTIQFLAMAGLFQVTTANCSNPDTSGILDINEVVQDSATGADASLQPTEITENFMLAFSYSPRTEKTPPELVVTNSMDPSKQAFIQDDVLGRLDPPVEVDPEKGACALGCHPSPDMRYLAVVTANTASGDVVLVLKLDSELNPVRTEFGEIENVRRFQFVGDTMFLSTIKDDCEPTVGLPKKCYEIKRLDISTGTITKLFEFPTADNLNKSAYSGMFTADADGTTVVTLDPLPGSLTLWAWSEEKGLKTVGEPICEYEKIGQTCKEDGGNFTDREPLGISSDGTQAVLALVENEVALKLFRFDLTNGTRTAVTLMDTPSEFGLNACYNRKDWQFTKILAPIVFSPDDSEVRFIGQAACNDNADKPWTNLVALPVAAIAGDIELGHDDFRWITRFPTGYLVESVSLLSYGFAASPSDEFMVLAGTPVLMSDWKPIPLESPQHVTDAEVYVTRTDGSASPVQISGSVDYAATSVWAW